MLSEPRDKPLFLALGYSEPHLALSAPKEYHDMYPPEEMELPKNPDSKENGMPIDESVLSEKAPHTLKQWREAISSQYACITLLDTHIGRLLDFLEETGREKNTIVVLWGDHGFMLGEHYQWKKGGLIDEALLVPLIVKAPAVTEPGSVCTRPVESVDLFPTFCQLCGIPIPKHAEGAGMLDLLKNPAMPWRKGAISCHGNPSNQTIRTERYRYIEFGGPERAELYDHARPEPQASTNVVDEPEYQAVRKKLAAMLGKGPEATLPP